MNLTKEIGILLRKEITLEMRTKYALGGILLYVASTVFVIKLSFLRTDPQTWNALFWITALFAGVNAVVKSFVAENTARQLYFYQIANPIAIILSKIIYNILLLLLVNILLLIVMSVMIHSPIRDIPQYILSIFLGASSFAIAFTFVSAIAAKASNAATMMAILSFPVILPVLLTLIRLSTNAVGAMRDTAWIENVYTLLGIDAILIALCFLLFPFLWRD